MFCSQPRAALLSGVPLVVPAVVPVLVPVWYSYLPVVYPFWYPFCQPCAAVVICGVPWFSTNKGRLLVCSSYHSLNATSKTDSIHFPFASSGQAVWLRIEVAMPFIVERYG